MPTVFDVTLKVSHLDIPKGTTCRITTSSEADHHTVPIIWALRKQGFYDDELKGILNSAYWEWKVVSDDWAKISEDLQKYTLARRRPTEAPSDDLKKEEKESEEYDHKKARRESEGFMKNVIKSFFDSESTDTSKAVQAFPNFEEEILEAQLKQGQIHKKEVLAFEKIKSLSYGNLSESDIDNIAKYIEAAQIALDNIDALYYGAQNRMKLKSDRKNAIRANIKFAKSLHKPASKGFLSTLLSFFKK